jgi:hypothetical protein
MSATPASARTETKFGARSSQQTSANVQPQAHLPSTEKTQEVSSVASAAPAKPSNRVTGELAKQMGAAIMMPMMPGARPPIQRTSEVQEERKTDISADSAAEATLSRPTINAKQRRAPTQRRSSITTDEDRSSFSLEVSVSIGIRVYNPRILLMLHNRWNARALFK